MTTYTKDMGKEDFEVTVTVLHESHKAWLVDDSSQEVWVPKSLISDADKDIVEGEDVTICVPMWFAEKVGFV